jgi:cell division protein FtsL
MNPRATNFSPFAFERTRRGSLQRALIVLLVIAVLILYVGGKVKIMRLGYQIESLEREKKELERSNASLRIEASSLSSAARIEEIAVKKLGMIRPSKDNVVVVKRKTVPAQ